MGYLMKFPGGFDDVYRYVKTALIMRENKVKRIDDVIFLTIGWLSYEHSWLVILCHGDFNLWQLTWVKWILSAFRSLVQRQENNTQ